MKLPAIAFAILISLSFVKLIQAQEQKDWIPSAVESLQQGAASKTNFTFDHSMLVLASKLEPDNEELRRVIAGVSGVSVRTCRFSGAWQYDRRSLAAVSDEYRAAGWKQLMNRHQAGGDSNSTNLWIRLENNAVSNFAILVAKSNEVDFVVVSGSMSPLDLSHLGGHFGIPKIDGGMVVPNAGSQQ
jgi:Domain of unknown function (DUF4252)